MMAVRLAVLVSGSGSNLQAILDACTSGMLSAEVVVVLSNRADAYALERATRAGVPTVVHSLARYKQAGHSRSEYDADLASLLLAFRPHWVVLAGWMHLLSMAFLRHFPNRVINLHPALPGQFPGTHAIERAWQAAQQGELRETGVMVHLVPDEGVDDGPVLATARVTIYPDEPLAALEERIHAVEHRLLVQTLAGLIDGAKGEE